MTPKVQKHKMYTRFDPKMNRTKCRAFRLVFLTFGRVFQQAEYWKTHLTTPPTNQPTNQSKYSTLGFTTQPGRMRGAIE